MPSKHSDKVELKVEILCGQGCSQVKQMIDDVRNGNTIKELDDCNQDEISQIIDELDKIMAVYRSDSKNCDDNEKE